MKTVSADYHKFIEQLVRTNGKKQENIVSLLHAIQDKYNHLPKEALETLIKMTEITPSMIAGVSTFYSQFRFKPTGKYKIKICVGTACHVKGGEDIYESIKEHLQIPISEDTDKYHIFTVEKVTCLGCCMLAPAIQIDNVTYGHVTADSIPNILNDFLESKATEEKKIPPIIRNYGPSRGTIRMCLCSSCEAAGARKVFNIIKDYVEKEDISVKLKSVGCTGISFVTPLLELETNDKKKFRYARVNAVDAPAIINHHFKPEKLSSKIRRGIENLLENLYSGSDVSPVIRYALNAREKNNIDFLSSQTQIATKNNGEMDPLDIHEYMEKGGFKALEGCLKERKPQNILKNIQASGLRGRGGAGYETYLKWKVVSESESATKYIICNGDEGDPGAFMDRMLLESFPFRVIEGMAIAAFACNIRKGFIFVRSEYPLAIERVKRAIELARKRGILGRNINNDKYKFDLELFVSAGAFVCGEETALIASIQGKRGFPSIRPPYPSEKGYRDVPTLINNVETFALVPWIILNGGEAFAKIGTEQSPGTKTFALAGKINNGGLIEVEMGTPINDIIFKIGRGIKNFRKFKAVQIGGPSGGCVPESLIDTKVDFEGLKDLGTMMGSGGMIVLDEDDCMVDIARYFMSFTQSESCGKCTFCRIGTKRMLEILEKMINGKGTTEELEKLQGLALHIKQNSLCGLGKAAPNPVLSAINYFYEEFAAHINKKCPAKKCKHLITYSISDKCIGCTKCAQRCPSDAIKITPYEKHVIDTNLCIKCDSCFKICPENAVEKK